MNWNAPKPTSNFQHPPVGQHKAILFALIDVGTQDTKNMQGQDVKQRQIYAQFELHGKNAPLIEGKPPMFSKRLTFSMHEKATLRAVVEAITNTTHNGNVYGDGIDILPAVGGACLLQLAETKKPDGSEGRKIQAVMPVDPDAPAPERVNPIRTFNLDHFDQTIFDGLPKYMQEVIAKSPEYQAANGNPSIRRRRKSPKAPHRRPPMPPSTTKSRSNGWEDYPRCRRRRIGGSVSEC